MLTRSRTGADLSQALLRRNRLLLLAIIVCDQLQVCEFVLDSADAQTEADSKSDGNGSGDTDADTLRLAASPYWLSGVSNITAPVASAGAAVPADAQGDADADSGGSTDTASGEDGAAVTRVLGIPAAAAAQFVSVTDGALSWQQAQQVRAQEYSHAGSGKFTYV